VVLKAICVYCTIMHACILVDFAIVTYFLFYKEDFGVTNRESSEELEAPPSSIPPPAMASR
jgi:hypothetical protein